MAPILLPEVREAGAPAEVAAIYVALREASGVPLVNLIWRHLATLDGALPWAWATVAPALRAGLVAGGRDRLAGALVLPEVPAVSLAQWQAAGLDTATLRTVRDIVAVYNRGNQTNLVMLTALRRELEGAPLTPGEASAAPVGPPLATVPALPRLAELAPEVQALAQDLAARRGTAPGVVPSLWLHLAHWPALLAALPGWLGPMLQAEPLRATRLAAMALAEREADALRPHLAPPGPAPQREPMLAALTNFTTLQIASMVPVGLALDRVLPAA
jgi:hypothetical protein